MRNEARPKVSGRNYFYVSVVVAVVADFAGTCSRWKDRRTETVPRHSFFLHRNCRWWLAAFGCRRKTRRSPSDLEKFKLGSRERGSKKKVRSVRDFGAGENKKKRCVMFICCTTDVVPLGIGLGRFRFANRIPRVPEPIECVEERLSPAIGSVVD